jgi:hypothetical protein
MKRLIATFFGVAAMSAGVFAQTNTTVRPRVAVTPTPPVIQNDSRTQDGPPTLIGGNRPKPAPTATPSVDDENEIIKVETELVTMPVSVLDRDGRFISGLNQRDFQIFENGVQQQVEYFQSVEQPFTVIIMIDVSPSTEFRIEEIQNAAIAFVDQLRPKDRVMVVAFDENYHVLSPVTNNRFQLRDAIRSAQFGNGTSLYEAVDEVIRLRVVRTIRAPSKRPKKPTVCFIQFATTRPTVLQAKRSRNRILAAEIVAETIALLSAIFLGRS